MVVDAQWPSGYFCLRLGVRERDGYRIRPIRRSDSEPVRHWRNAQLDVLRQSGHLSAQQQDGYFDLVVRAEMAEPQPPQILLGLEHEGVLVGYGGLVHIAWEHRRAEISFLYDPARIAAGDYSRDMTAFLHLLQVLAAEELDIHRLWAETYAFRDEHIGVLERAGFALEGRMRDHVIVNGQFVDSLVHGSMLEGDERT